MFWSSVEIELLFTGFVVNVLELCQNVPVFCRFWIYVKIYLFFTGFVVDVLEHCQNLTVVHRFCGECFGALSKSNCCLQVLW